MRVREQNAIDATGEFRQRCIKPPSLARETRGAFDEPTLSGDGVDEPKAGRIAPLRRIAPRIFAANFFATRLRETAILRRAKHNGERPPRRFNAFNSKSSRPCNGRAGEELAARYFQVLSFNGLPLVVRI
jgi:hypothetical protein